MLTYTYKCDACDQVFEQRQTITEPALTQCPECGGSVRRIITGGAGFIMKKGAASEGPASGTCSFDRSGQTCCGRSEPCGQKPCGG